MIKIFSKKKEDNKVVNIFIIAFLVIGIIYSIVTIVKNSFQKPIPYNTSNIKQYISEEKLLKSDYFYTLDSQVANFLEAVDKEMYFDLYQILMGNYNKIYSKSEITKVLKQYKQDYFIYEKDSKYKYYNHLMNAYAIDSSTYLLQLDFNNKEFYIIMGKGKDTYTFTIVE